MHYEYDIYVHLLVLVIKLGSIQRSRDLLMSEVVFSSNRGTSGDRNMDELDLPMFDFNTIIIATNDFLEENKLGQGGFGSVYRVSCFSFQVQWITDVFGQYGYHILQLIVATRESIM